MISNSMKEDLREAMEILRGNKPLKHSPTADIADELQEKKNADVKDIKPEPAKKPEVLPPHGPSQISGNIPAAPVAKKEEAPKVEKEPQHVPAAAPAPVKEVEKAKEIKTVPEKPVQQPIAPSVVKDKQDKTAQGTGLVKNMKSVRKKNSATRLTAKLLILFVFAVLLVSAIFILPGMKLPGSAPSTTPSTNNANTNSNQNNTAQVVNTDDSKRMESIDTISTAVAMYCFDQKADLPITSSYIKLNSDNPVSQFIKEALDKYNQPESSMLDPKDPDFYYAYKSTDGKTIEFTARMEDTSGALCDNSISTGGMCLFRKVLTQDDLKNLSTTMTETKDSDSDIGQ